MEVGDYEKMRYTSPVGNQSLHTDFLSLDCGHMRSGVCHSSGQLSLILDRAEAKAHQNNSATNH